MSFVAYGQNIVVEMIDKMEETVMGKVLASSTKKCPKGSIVLYCERDYLHLHVGKKLCHVLWEPHIRMIMVDNKEVEKFTKDLPDMRNK